MEAIGLLIIVLMTVNIVIVFARRFDKRLLDALEESAKDCDEINRRLDELDIRKETNV